MDFKRILRAPLFWVVAVVAITLMVFSLSDTGGYTRIDTSAAQKLIAEHKVDRVVVTDNEVVDLDLKRGQSYSDGKSIKGATKVRTQFVDSGGPSFIKLVEDNVPPGGMDQVVKDTNPFLALLGSILPVIILLGLFWFLMNQMQGGGSRVMQFGKSKAKLASKDTPKVTFADVAGADEAVEELHEIKEFLAEPAKFLAVGAKIPKGVLLYGPPGTGKTLLARAVAGEAGVPFYSISGSDFVEMFVGVGASRVRDLFEQAKANAPAIVFVDEIDAVGRHRGAGLGGGHDEREQTLNQLLVEMDGFDVKTNVILIAATNRPDILDPALLRPGRFDRQIAVEAPDMIGRHRILEVHSQGKPMATGVDLLAVARRTPGFTGADLANVLNEAALLTARSDKLLIDDHALDEAIDRVIAGPQKRTRIMSAKERKITAYHEGGHALVAAAMNHTRPRHQGDDPAARPRPRLHDGHADRRQVLHHPQRDPRPAGLRAGRSRRRGGRLPRPHHRRRERHREGHRDGPQDGHRVRHERARRRHQARPVAGRGLPRPRHGPPARLLRRGRQRRRQGGARASSTTPMTRRGTSSTTTARSSTASSWTCSSTRRSTPRSSRSSSSRCASARCAPPGCPARRASCPTSRPVLTPAEKAAQNGSLNGLEAAGSDRRTAEAIDKAAEEGAVPQVDEEHPPTQVIEVPEGGQVDPREH